MKEKAKQFVSAAFKSAIGYSIYKAAYQLEQQAINKAKNKAKDATLYTIYISKSNVTNGALVGLMRAETPKYHTLIDGKFEEGVSGIGSSPHDCGMYVRFYNKTPIFINFNDAFVGYKDYYSPYSTQIMDPVGMGFNSEIRPVRGQFQNGFRSRTNIPITPTPAPAYNSNTSFISVSTLNNKKMINDMKTWLKKLVKKAEKDRWEMIDNSKTIELTSNRDDMTRTMKKRTLETVFIDENIKKDIMDSLDAFVSNREWYDDNFIPYHYGILLYGPAGTGKSTLIRAIITEYYKKYSRKQYMIESPNYLSSPSDLLHLNEEGICSTDWAPRIIIIEDIDATILKKRMPEKDEEKSQENISNEYTPPLQFGNRPRLYYDSISLSEVLNKMDGVANIENVIYIFTTNHVENLDPALIRPGRIDKMIEIKIPRREDYDAFMHYHFKKHIPDDIEIKTHKLIAELQTDIVCKKTYEEMLEILQKED